jgi:hypothetical protein
MEPQRGPTQHLRSGIRLEQCLRCSHNSNLTNPLCRKHPSQVQTKEKQKGAQIVSEDEVVLVLGRWMRNVVSARGWTTTIEGWLTCPEEYQSKIECHYGIRAAMLGGPSAKF